jgi:hypothetical protein
MTIKCLIYIDIYHICIEIPFKIKIELEGNCSVGIVKNKYGALVLLTNSILASRDTGAIFGE